MSHPHMIEEEAITASEVKNVLDRIQKRDTELSFRAGKTMDHLNHLALAKMKKQKEFAKAIEELNVPRLKENHVTKIIDIMPKSVKELNIVLTGYTLTANKDYQQKIIDVLNA